MKPALRYFAVFISWNITVDLLLLLTPPVVSLPVSMVLTGAFLWGYLLHSRRPARHWTTLRLRPLLPPAAYWMAAAVPIFVAFTAALGEVYVRLVPVPPEDLDVFRALMTTPLGRLAVTFRAVVYAAVLEEMVFRGLIQRPLERRWGPGRALAVTSLLFALIHFLPRILPVHFFLGLAFGYAVYLTRSIWAGVALHAANNAAAVLGMGLARGQAERMPTVWETGPTPEWWLGVVVMVLTGALLAGIARRIREGTPRLRRDSADEYLGERP